VHLSEDGFSESGASGFDLSSSNRGTDSFQPYIGAALAQKFVTDGGTEMTPELRFGYAREALSGSRLLTVTAAGGASFPVIGVRPSRDQVTAGIGITVVAGPDSRSTPITTRSCQPATPRSHPLRRTTLEVLSRVAASSKGIAVRAVARALRKVALRDTGEPQERDIATRGQADPRSLRRLVPPD